MNRLFGWRSPARMILGTVRSVCLFHLTVIAILASLVCTTVAPAQVSKGTIAGRTVDSAGGLLQGARVELQPVGASRVSDNNGEFTLNDLPPGEYILTVTFVGLMPFEKNLTVTAGQTTRVEAALQIASQSDSISALWWELYSAAADQIQQSRICCFGQPECIHGG